MIDLTTKYMGLTLRNPIIVGSSGLSETLDGLKDLEKHGAGAVVLKSLFEEEIILEMQQAAAQMNAPGNIYPEMNDFFDLDTVEDSVSKYLRLIEDAKKELSIPVIASVNCVSSHEWPVFAKRIEKAGADALELNVFLLPSDFEHTSEENEKVYFEVIDKVKKEISIPVSLKISYFFSNLGSMIKRLSETNVDALVMFNRSYNPDFNIDNFSITSTNVLSTPGSLSTSLRWIAIMSQRVSCDLAASTGVHSGRAVIKQILAGAQAVQVVSALYRHGNHKLSAILDEMVEWMKEKGYDSPDEFRGRMSQARSGNPAAYERVQFMKYFSGK